MYARPERLLQVGRTSNILPDYSRKTNVFRLWNRWPVEQHIQFMRRIQDDSWTNYGILDGRVLDKFYDYISISGFLLHSGTSNRVYDYSWQENEG
ncbi:hypothetical protein GDO81_002920 [Engystomops pustulosus]|uniref:Uncharacterized protein n=1 Tax=Engystomops pustulosus TaxID=76066 RepID=A0AAV7DNS4_ENGPU|nr:hypothetical protein GDO81_002920 [Engystomops pustulosus]